MEKHSNGPTRTWVRVLCLELVCHHFIVHDRNIGARDVFRAAPKSGTARAAEGFWPSANLSRSTSAGIAHAAALLGDDKTQTLALRVAVARLFQTLSSIRRHIDQDHGLIAVVGGPSFVRQIVH